MLVTPLSSEERLNGGFTHRINITYADLTETAANTAQTIELISLPAGSAVMQAAIRLVTPFEDVSDTGLNTTTLIVGDDGDTDRFIASVELNDNASEVYYKLAPVGTTTSPHVYTAANTVDAVFGSMAAKALNDIDAGEINIYLTIADLTKL